MLTFSYWNHKGLYQTAGDRLNKLIPMEGSVPNPRSTNKNLEKFRKASNCYHDLYNNGLCNRAEEFRNVFSIASSQFKTRRVVFLTNGRSYHTTRFDRRLYEKVEERMNQIVFAAAKEQGFATVADTYPEAAEMLN